ncbi:Asp/Glu/hydantoin racemase [Bradyrhizobium sp. LA6.10]|uniref:hypothetical protein n=1 Tax=Bradyrhizobium sp. LA6.10 TaxID=3156318 RepID=UPI0033959323
MSDPGLPGAERRFFSLRPGQSFYGAPIGILQLQRVDRPGIRPFIPGSVGNASTWTVPVRYKTVPGLTFDRLLGPVDVDMKTAVTQAAIELEREGAQLITSNCGFMVRYQEVVRAAVEVPVLLSSLLLGPFLERMLPRKKALGIITANASSLTSDLLEAAGLSGISERVIVAGLEGAPAFAAAFLKASGDLDVGSVEGETVDAAITLLKRRPDIGVLLFECSELPPYAAAVQRTTGIPVFDFTSMVEFFVGGLIRKPFIGLS